MPPPSLVSYSGESDANARTPAATVPEAEHSGDLLGVYKKGLRRKKWGVYSGDTHLVTSNPPYYGKKHTIRRFAAASLSELNRC